MWWYAGTFQSYKWSCFKELPQAFLTTPNSLTSIPNASLHAKTLIGDGGKWTMTKVEML
jgi:hypothetical protein